MYDALKKEIGTIILIQIKMMNWFDLNGREFLWRNPESSNYVRVLIEVLVQRTRAEYVDRLLPSFLKDFPDWQSLANAEVAHLEEMLKPIGLWRRRALSLSGLSNKVVESGCVFPQDRKEIRKWPGVGEYVANAIMLFVHGERLPLVDSNMVRIIERCFGPRKLVDYRCDPWLNGVAKELVDHEQSIELNWALLDLGALICKPRNPLYLNCPINDLCLHGRHVLRTGADVVLKDGALDAQDLVDEQP